MKAGPEPQRWECSESAPRLVQPEPQPRRAGNYLSQLFGRAVGGQPGPVDSKYFGLELGHPPTRLSRKSVFLFLTTKLFARKMANDGT